MKDRVVMASKFKEQCLAMIDQVASSKISIIVTKRGQPLARLVPYEGQPTGRPTMGSVKLKEKDDKAYFSTGEDWEAEGPSGKK